MERLTRERSAIIGIYKLIASLCIAIFHYEWLYIGEPNYFGHFYIYVEFFFIVSGFFFARNVEVTKKEPIENAMLQIKKMYPAYVIAFFFSWLIQWKINDWNAYMAIRNLWLAKWELLMIHIIGIDSNIHYMNAVTGQIPVMIIAGIFVWYWIQRHKYFFINIAPLVSVAVYAHIINVYGNLSQWYQFENYFCVGIIRGGGRNVLRCMGVFSIASQSKKICFED